MTAANQPLDPDNPLASLYGDNPLITALGPRVAFTDWPARLATNPLAEVSLAGLHAEGREEALELQKQCYAPTALGIDIAAALQSMHRQHYWQRHPRSSEARKKRIDIAVGAATDTLEPEHFPWFADGASGLIIKGITGMGKSSLIKRYLSLLPKQVVVHENGSLPGYEFLKQIVWLKVDMSSDGTRGGLLIGILTEVDRLLGTNYHMQFAKYTLDKLAIKVGVILSTYYCGMLIIDEVQEKNFDQSKWRSEHEMFFLRILNFGIPIVLLGNPLGFVEHSGFVQNIRRFSNGGIFDIPPAMYKDNKDFQTIASHALDLSVMPQRSPDGRQYFLDKAFQYSGGIYDFVFRLNVESQLLALREGSTAVRPRHIDQAFKSSARIAPNANLINGLTMRDAATLRDRPDIPIKYLQALWEAHPITPSPNTEVLSSEGMPNETHASQHEGKAMEKPKTGATTVPACELKPQFEPQGPLRNGSLQHPAQKQFKATQTRKANEVEQAKKLRQTLPKDDVRTPEGSKRLMKSFEEMRKDKRDRS
jgi:AAA domain